MSSTESVAEDDNNENNENEELDFDIEEKQESDIDTSKENSPVKEIPNEDKNLFAELLNKKPVQTDINRNEKKKLGRISQKERKRLSREAAEVSSVTEDDVSPSKSSWSGWAANASSPSSSSLVDIMKLESKSPSNQTNDKPKFSKKTSWRKVDLGGNNLDGPPSTSPSPVKTNPWNLSPISSEPAVVSTIFDAPEPTDMQTIMSNDARESENLIKAKSKPFHITQIEEKAIAELGNFYNVANCKDETITITRVNKGTIATPIWKKISK